MKNRGEEPPPEDERESETAFDNNDRDREEGETSFNNPDDDRDREVETNKVIERTDDRDDQRREAERNLNKRIAGKEREKTNIKKRILFELGYNLGKGDGKKSEELFNRLKLTENEKTLKPNGMTFDKAKIIFLEKSGKYNVSKNRKLKAKITDFRILAEEARLEHKQTAVSDIEEVSPNIFIKNEHARSILSNCLEKLNEEISDREEKLRPLVTGQDLREFNGILKLKFPTLQEREEGNISVKDRIRDIRIQETKWMKSANEARNDSEHFPFPNLEKVNVTVEGNPNDLYSEGLAKRDMFDEAQRFFGNGLRNSFVSLEKFYVDKFACVLDFRTVDDEKVSGSGRNLIGTQAGILLEIEKKATSKNLACHVFVIADGIIDVVENKLQKLKY